MNVLKSVAVGLVIAGISFSAISAEQITNKIAKEKKYQKIGTVTSKGEATSPSELESILSDKADKLGGKYFVVISGKEVGRFAVGTATVYK